MRPQILITGANGFVGRALCSDLIAAGYAVRGTRRSVQQAVDADSVSWATIPDIVDAAWEGALDGVTTVVHLAARVHEMRHAVVTPLAAFRRANVLGTENLAHIAAREGVKRFIFLSSIKVNGEETSSASSGGKGGCFSETDQPSPQDPYAISKWEAEQSLQRIAVKTGMEVVVLRCPLVYGPGVKGNFLRLMQAVDRGIPLPLALVNNRRSLMYLGNLISTIITCMERREAAGKTYLVSDGEEISTAQLILQLALALGRPSRLWPISPSLIRLVAGLAGKSAEVNRLLGSLQIDSSKIRCELGWVPAYTLAQGLAETAAWYRRQV